MTCFFCKGQTVETTTKFIVDLGQCVVIVKNVPARVCQQCGEASFSDEVAQQLEKIVGAVKASMMSEVAIIEYSRSVA
ncbi:MAG: type II toxin-antitoxin system MqsA family antitoxin [Oscillospiraceae bacterium]|nr:type II toxin-antitoxin system MqsA family antitoxin [Oscillospiraceae bacterium]